MTKPISEEQKLKIIEAHKLKLSPYNAAKYSGISRNTVLNYWRKLGLKLYFKSGKPPISEEIQELIYAAWELKRSATETATYLGISYNTVLNYWRKRGLELPPRIYYILHRPIKVGLTNLLDDVFNTATNPDERLELEQIVGRLEDWLGTEKINLKDLQEKISQLVGWGYYAVVQEGGKTYYKAGMPSAMDGMVKKELVAK